MNALGSGGSVEQDSYSGKQEDDGEWRRTVFLSRRFLKWLEVVNGRIGSILKKIIQISMQGLSTEKALQVALLLLNVILLLTQGFDL